MFYFIKFFYTTFLLPPGFLIIFMVLFCIKLYKKQRNLAFIFIGITVFFYITTTAVCSDLFIRSLERRYHPPAQLAGDVIIVLGGGATLDTPNVHGKGNLSGSAANRLLTGLELYQALKVPLILSGGQVYKTAGPEAEISRQILLSVGIPSSRIIIENASLNTTENARYTTKILKKYGFHRPVLVTSAFHMPRSVRAFTKLGVQVTPYPADYHTNVAYRFGWGQLAPSADALGDVSLALKEYLGLLVSKWY